MPAFFEALDAQGQTRKGLLEADTAKSARSMLRAQALVPLTVELVQTGSRAAAPRWASACSPARVQRHHAGGLDPAAGRAGVSGLPLERALTALATRPTTSASATWWPPARRGQCGLHLCPRAGASTRASSPTSTAP
jgi:type II secretory pathway component PulF